MLTIVKKNDSYDAITYQLENEDNSTVDLTGANVNFVMGKKNKLITNAKATVTSATSGIVSYQLTPSDTLVSGTFLAEFVVTFSNGTTKTYPSNGYITVDVEQNLDTSQNNVVLDMIATKQGDFEAKLDSILKQGTGIQVSAMNEYTWTATSGQTIFVFPTNAKYDPSAKWFQVSVGNVPIANELINRTSSSQFSLVVDPSLIVAGMTVHAMWVEPIVPITGGHHSTHEINGQDEINIVNLRNYQELVATPLADKASQASLNTTNANVTANTTALTDTTQRVKNIYVDVKKDFGAIGDGVTDDTTAIQSALNTLPVNSVLFFPIGTYKVSSQLTWDGTINLIGADRDSAIIKASTSFTTLLYKKDEAMVCGKITGLTFDGNGLVNYVFDFPRGKGLRAYHNFFKNAKNSVVRFGSSATWGAYEVHFYDNNVHGLEGSGASANRPTYALELASNSSDSEFYENILTNCSEAGILSNGTHNYVRDNHVYGYPFDYTPKYGIKITNITNRAYHNRLDTPSVSGIYCNKWGNTIEANHTFWNGAYTILTGTSGITLDNIANNMSSILCKDNFTEGASIAQDIVVNGNMPDRSRILDNTTNAVKAFSSMWRGTISVPANATSVSLTYLVPFPNYNYIVKTSGNFNSFVGITTSLTGATFNIATPVTWTGAILYWEVSPF